MRYHLVHARAHPYVDQWEISSLHCKSRACGGSLQADCGRLRLLRQQGGVNPVSCADQWATLRFTVAGSAPNQQLLSDLRRHSCGTRPTLSFASQPESGSLFRWALEEVTVHVDGHSSCRTPARAGSAAVQRDEHEASTGTACCRSPSRFSGAFLFLFKVFANSSHIVSDCLGVLRCCQHGVRRAGVELHSCGLPPFLLCTHAPVIHKSNARGEAQRFLSVSIAGSARVVLLCGPRGPVVVKARLGAAGPTATLNGVHCPRRPTAR